MNTPVHEYASTKRDFLDAQRLHRKNRPWSAVSYGFWYVVLPGGSVAYLLYWASLWFTHGRAAAIHNIVWAGLALYLASLLSFARWWQIQKLWNQMQPKKYRGLPVTLQFDDKLIISARPGDNEGRWSWNAVEDFAEDERLAILYVRKKLFLMVPKRIMDEHEWERLRTLALPHKVKK